MPDRLTPADLDLDPGTTALLDAVIAMSSDLDLHSVLERIVRSAMELTDARYGALGVIGDDGTLADFITHGIDRATEDLIGDRPHGRGILGVLINDPQPLRLADLGTDPRSFGLPKNHPPMRSFLGLPVRIRGTVFGNLYLTEKNGGREFTRQDEVLVEALATSAGFMIENARAYRISELRRAWLEASTELANVLQPPIDRARAVRHLAAAMRSLTRSRAAIFINRAFEGELEAIAAEPGQVEAMRELGAAVAAALPPRLDRSVNFAQPFEHGEDSGIVVPVPAQLAGRGAMVLVADPQAPIQYEERDLLLSFAQQAALALDRAQAIDDRANLAVVSDRERIARDLHDVVIQRLFACGLQLQALNARVEDESVREVLDAMLDQLDVTVKNIRSTIFELRETTSGSLRAEVRNIVREYVAGMGFTPVVRTTGPIDAAVPEAIREHLVTVLREAVSNLARHAKAASAEIELSVTRDTVELAVFDDGVGPSEAAAESGLRNARQRAEALGGSFALERRSPRGSVFRWTVPLRP